MNLKEFDSFSLSDAIHFHDHLNPVIFDGDNMNHEVRERLLLIAQDFIDHLGIHHLDVDDITLSGSNAAYTYTSHSDIDVHILVDMDKINCDDVYREFFNAKKIIYNDTHDIKIHGYDVELYVQDSNEPVISLGEYSIQDDKWIRLPRKRKSDIDQMSAKLKYQKLLGLAEFALKSNDLDKIHSVLKIIKKYRQAGLDLNGEFGPENIAFKVLRTKGMIGKLYKRADRLHSKELSIPEDATLLNKPTLSVNQVAKKHNVSTEYILSQLMRGMQVELEHTDIDSVAREIALDHLNERPDYYEKLTKVGLEEAFDQPYKMKWEKSEYGDYDALATLDDGTYLSIMFEHTTPYEVNISFWRNNSLEVTGEGDAQRIFATVLVAIQQFLKKEQPANITFSASKEVEPGQNVQSRAKLYNRLVQRYAQSWGYQAQAFDHGDKVDYELTKIKKDVNECSGYIPSESEKNDPRWLMALSVDVKPQTLKKSAKQMGWTIARDGRPPLLR